MIVSTKLNKTAEEKTTRLNVDWNDCPIETIKGLAMQALVVKLQGGWRRAGVIPDELNVAVKDHAPGTRGAGVSVESKVLALSDAEKKALVDKLLASMGE